MKMICEFCGVSTSSFGLVMRDLLRLGRPRLVAPVALKFAFEDTARTSPRWVIRFSLQRRHPRLSKTIACVTTAPQILEGQRNGPPAGGSKFVESVGNIRFGE